MKITLFNDTHKDWALHAASVRGTKSETRISARTSADFEVLEGHDVFVKVWDHGLALASGTAMVRQSIKTECPRLPGMDQDDPDHMGG